MSTLASSAASYARAVASSEPFVGLLNVALVIRSAESCSPGYGSLRRSPGYVSLADVHPVTFLSRLRFFALTRSRYVTRLRFFSLNPSPSLARLRFSHSPGYVSSSLVSLVTFTRLRSIAHPVAIPTFDRAPRRDPISLVAFTRLRSIAHEWPAPTSIKARPWITAPRPNRSRRGPASARRARRRAIPHRRAPRGPHRKRIRTRRHGGCSQARPR